MTAGSRGLSTTSENYLGNHLVSLCLGFLIHKVRLACMLPLQEYCEGQMKWAWKCLNCKVVWLWEVLQLFFNILLKTPPRISFGSLAFLINYSNFNPGIESTFIAIINSNFKLFFKKNFIQWDQTCHINITQSQEWFPDFTAIKRKVRDPVVTWGGDAVNLSTLFKSAH